MRVKNFITEINKFRAGLYAKFFTLNIKGPFFLHNDFSKIELTAFKLTLFANIFQRAIEFHVADLIWPAGNRLHYAVVLDHVGSHQLNKPYGCKVQNEEILLHECFQKKGLQL